MEVLFGTKIVVTGDRVRTGECSLLVMNHRTRLDWNFLWAAMFYAAEPQTHRMKFVLKAPIRHAPGPGILLCALGRDENINNNL
jgi:lysocardiolipin and lysophospholipid acyltransferase